MSEKKYTLDDVKAWALYEIGIEGEDFIYRKEDREVFPDDTLGYVDCHYYINDEPSCIVGRMLHNQGIISAEKAAPYEDSPARAVISHVARGLFTDEALGFIAILQSCQDQGVTWGESYQEALGYVAK